MALAAKERACKQQVGGWVGGLLLGYCLCTQVLVVEREQGAGQLI